MIQKIRVLQIIPKLATGGAERVVLDLLQHLDRRQFETAAVSLYPCSNEPFEQKAIELGLKVIYLNKHLGIDPWIFSQVHSIVKRFQPQVVHTHLTALYTALPAFILNGIPVRVYTLHNPAQRTASPIWRRLYHRIAFQNIGVVPVSISHSVCKTVQKMFGELASPVIYNGVDTQSFAPSLERRACWRMQQGISPQSLVFVNVARLSAQKNHILLLKAFKELTLKIPDAILLLVGDGELREDLQRFADQVDLRGRVHFLGVRSDVADILNASDVYVSSSDWEGFGISIVEAMAAGKPVVATAVDGVLETVSHNETGLLVPRGELNSLVAAMCEVGSDQNLAARLGEQGREIAEQRFDVREMARQYGELYIRLLERSNPLKWL